METQAEVELRKRQRALEGLRYVPRKVPLSVQIRILFGGFAAFAWIWFGFGGALATGFLRSADLTSWFLLRSPQQTYGTVDTCAATHSSEGGSKHHRGTPIYANRYHYQVDGTTYRSVSYVPGICLDAGAGALVEYAPQDPRVSRIEGMRRATFGPQVSFVLIFPVAGAAMVIIATVLGRSSIRLLKNGNLGWGRLLDETPTNVRLNGRPVMKLRFALEHEDGKTQEVTLRTNSPEKLRGDGLGPLLFDPEAPGEAVSLDLMRIVTRPDAPGEIQGDGLVVTTLRLVPPLLAVAAHALAWSIPVN